MKQQESLPAIDRFLRRLTVGLYGFVYAFYFGLVTLDSVYSRLLQADMDPSETAGIFREISDFLLVPFGFLLLAGAAAFAAAVKCPRAVNLIIVSWLLPIAALGMVQYFGTAIDAAGFSTAIRLLTAGAGSVLAMAAVSRYRDSEATLN